MEKKSNTSLVIVCLVALVLIGVTGVVAFNYGKEQASDKEEVKVEDKKEEEKDITNKALKEFFLQKIAIIETASLKGMDASAKINSIYSKDIVGTENLDTDSMYTSVFDNNQDSFEQVPEKLSDHYDEQANVKPLLEDVKNIYGDIDDFSGKTKGCPTYYLNKDIVYRTYRCGFVITHDTISFLDRITELDKSTYVYVYVGAYESSEKDGLNTIYSDPNLQTKYKTQSINASLKFTEKEYKNFTQFRYTFIKNADGYYIFSKLEKIAK